MRRGGLQSREITGEPESQSVRVIANDAQDTVARTEGTWQGGEHVQGGSVRWC